jgi:hypothetical protein
MKKVKQHGKMPNSGGGGAPSSPPGGRSNSGSTGGIRQEAGTNQGATKTPDTKNLFPNGLS